MSPQEIDNRRRIQEMAEATGARIRLLHMAPHLWNLQYEEGYLRGLQRAYEILTGEKL